MNSAVGEGQGTRNPLDEEVAIQLLGFRWVVWKSLDSFPLPMEEAGRFLAPSDGPLAEGQVPAGPEVPLAKEPDRYVPLVSSDAEAALELARQVGLFVAGNAFLSVSPLGEWTVCTEDGRVWASGRSVPEVLCRAAMEWHAAQGGSGRRSVD